MRRNPQLDLLRAVAVLMVIGYHLNERGWMRWGWMGVDLFFVLSGFLISGLLFADLKQFGRIRMARFYLRRGLKIYPAYFFFMTVTAMIPFVRHRMSWSDFLFFQNYVRRAAWGHTWSLAVEEHFYFVLPLLLAVLWRLKLQSLIPYLAGALLAICLVLRAHGSSDWVLVAFPTHLRCDALFVGVALGFFHHFHPRTFQRLRGAALLALGVACVLPTVLLPQQTFYVRSFGLGLNAVGFGALLCWAMNTPRLRWKAMERIGEHSYSIYLWHYPITLMFLITLPGAIYIIPGAALCCVVGIAMAQLVEMPVLQMRGRLSQGQVPRVQPVHP